MVLPTIVSLVRDHFPRKYGVHVVTGVVGVIIARALSQGRRTNRERDLHARTILVTGGFTPLGLTLLLELAQRGAHIIALTQEPVSSPRVTVLIDLLRTDTSNEQIFAEHCDLSSPTSINSFVKNFTKSEDKRIDGVIFAHEYQHIGSPPSFATSSQKEDTAERDIKALATFLMITLLLPVLLVAPVERDIRIINVVNRFYAAAAAHPFSKDCFPCKEGAIFPSEAHRSLRSSILMRHLQRILDALPSAPPPQTDSQSSTIPVVSAKSQKSNIVSISVSPGISRLDTVTPLLNADWRADGNGGYSFMGTLLYMLLFPLIFLISKSPLATVQSILHIIFLPTPFKVLSQVGLRAPGESDDALKKKGTPIDSEILEMPEEVLKPGALYAECSVVHVPIPIPTPFSAETAPNNSKGKKKARPDLTQEVPDDQELGGEATGRAVWESYEAALAQWLKSDPIVEAPEPPTPPKTQMAGPNAR